MKRIHLIGMVLMSLLISASYAGFGERGGILNYNMSLGSQQTKEWVLVNSFNYPINFFIVPYSSNVAQISYSALNGTINSNSSYVINITVNMPSSASIGSWQGSATAYAMHNSSGASISYGTNKAIHINSYGSTTTTSTIYNRYTKCGSDLLNCTNNSSTSSTSTSISILTSSMAVTIPVNTVNGINTNTTIGTTSTINSSATYQNTTTTILPVRRPFPWIAAGIISIVVFIVMIIVLILVSG